MSAPEAEALRAALRRLADLAREAVEEYPGAVVVYDPIALANGIDAILSGRASEDHERMNRRAKAMADALRNGAAFVVTGVNVAAPPGRAGR